MPRRYRSRLREQQTAATRQQILDAAWELLRTTRPGDLAYRDVAARAQTSTRTVYRHFPTAQDLFQALTDRLLGTFLEPGEPVPTDFASGLKMLGRQFEALERDPALFRLIFAIPHRERVDDKAASEQLFAGALRDVPPAHRAAATGLLDLLGSPYAWDVLHANWGADARVALRAVEVGFAAVLTYLQAHPDALDPDGPSLFPSEDP